MTRNLVVVTVTAPDGEWLAEFVAGLVTDGLIACGNIVAGVRSVYRWEGSVVTDTEALAVLHTTADRVDALRARVDRDHPYAVPQFVVLPATASPAYAAWVGEAR